MQLAITRENLIGLCRSVMCYFEDEAERRSIRFIFHSNKENIEVWIDKEKIEKVLMNIISNAFKYTKPGGVVDLYISPDENNVHIKVIDTGIGLSSGDVSRIFDRFYQGSKKKGSTGLGLAIVKAIGQYYGIEVDYRYVGGEHRFILSWNKLP